MNCPTCGEALFSGIGIVNHVCSAVPTTTYARDPGLVRAELVDGIRDLADVWRQKSKMEAERGARLDEIAEKIAAGGSASGDDALMNQDWQRAYNLCEMRMNELQLRVNRLLVEHGNN